jgi:TolB-like protein/DNA-binding winged helix-turn-helix (wHTH) protein/Tfp pilus assembly protein PilF
MREMQCYTFIPKAAAFVSSGPIKFDEFVLDCDRYELHRGSDNIRLEKIPMELLILLVGSDGKLVSRQEIIDHLWGKDVFVDTEHGINTAIRKIRQALKDDPDQPRFVQTVTGKGYRFIAECRNGNAAAVAQAEESQSTIQRAEAQLTTPAKNSRSWLWATIPAGVVCVVLGLALGFNLGGLRDRIFSGDQVGPIHSIAVLPLTNLSGDKSLDYFSDGMTDEMITALAQNHSLRVISRTSAMQYKGVNKPLPEIAKALGVDGILEGSVMRTNGQVHVNLQLIYAPTDTHVWAQSYDRDLKDAISLPEEVSQTIASETKVPSAATAVKPQRTISPEAHDAYLQGRYFWFGLNLPRSTEYFEKAVQLQPDYAAAWSGLADTYVGAVINGDVPPQPMMTKFQQAATNALQLDDALPEAHNTMAAQYLFNEWDWPRAESESRRAVELDPHYAEAHHVYSYILMVMNRNDEALQQQKLCTELDPFQRPWALGLAYIQVRKYDDAIKELRLRRDAQPNHMYVRYYLFEAYWLKGMWKEAEAELEATYRAGGNEEATQTIHRAFEKGGEKAVEQWSLDFELARAKKQHVPPYIIAVRYAFLGDKEHTLKYLDAAYRERFPWLVFLQKEPVFDFLHSDERYRTIVKDMGLPPAW